MRRDDGRTDHHAAFWRLYLDGARRYPWTWLSVGGEATSIWIPPGGSELSAAQEQRLFQLATTHLGSKAADYLELGKPQSGIRELYTRNAKALVSVGAGAGSDRPVGLPLELIAERNPYQLGVETSLPVRLLLDGKPLEGATIKVFNEKDRMAARRYVTDPEGRARIELPINDRYLVSAVHMMTPAPAEQAKADWTSLWASLTFMRP